MIKNGVLKDKLFNIVVFIAGTIYPLSMYINLTYLFSEYFNRATTVYTCPKDKSLAFKFFASLINKIKSNGNNPYTCPQTSAKSELFIILADDDHDDRELFEEAITEIHSKIKVLGVEDGGKLLEILNTTNFTLPDIIFLDLNMPGKNGKECLKEIRNNAKFNNIPVVIYSTSANTKDVHEAYTAGADLYVSKPNSYTALISILKKVFLIDWEFFNPSSSKNNFLLSADTL